VFVDASALVAFVTQESDFEELQLKLKRTKTRLVSPIVLFESTLAIRRLRQFTPNEALGLVGNFLYAYAIKEIDIPARCATHTVQVFERYGKGRHKAALNMGDCFAYACAKIHRVPLLCISDNFIHTDIDVV
jgi:ribonuclease VapC